MATKKNTHGNLPIDPENQTFTFPGGRVVNLNGLGEAVLTGLGSEHGRPDPPTREVELIGGAIRHFPRSDDEPFLSEEEVEAIKNPKKREEEKIYRQYRLDLQRWNTEKGHLFARTIFILGVEDFPTAEEELIWRAIGFKDPYDIKYMWLALLCKGVDTWTSFIEAIMSLSMPTDEGVAEMQELFRDGVAGQPPQAVGID
jgi:hypothetical protein